MTPFVEALAAVLAHARPLPRHRVALQDALGCVLAKPLRARFDSPRFDQSAMDGWAVRAGDTARACEAHPVVLRVGTTIRAGDPGAGCVRPGTAARIMTGAPLPAGADAVVRKEACEETANEVRFRRPAAVGENIRRQGEEFRRGDPVLPAGTGVTPAVIGALATFGYASVDVHRKPVVALVVTGNELTVPGERLRRGAIYDANTFALEAALDELGIRERTSTRAADDLAATERAVRAALRKADVVLTAGGVSVGEHDLVKGVFERLGVATVHWRVAIKPGMPNYFGTWKRKGARGRPVLVFGLPGNPVAALLSYHQFAKPALRRMMGEQALPDRAFRAVLQGELTKKAGRLEWVRAVARPMDGTWTVTPVGGRGSHMVGGLAQANALIVFPADATHLEAGQQVTVESLEWSK